MKPQGPITNRPLTLQSQCAFVCADLEWSCFGKPMATSTMNEQHPATSQRPVELLGYEDWMHPGKGGA